MSPCRSFVVYGGSHNCVTAAMPITGFTKKMRNHCAYPAVQIFKKLVCKASTRY